MIAFTSARLLDAIAMDPTAYGEPMVAGITLDQFPTTSGFQMLTVPKDKVFLATQIVVQADSAGLVQLVGGGTGNQSSPSTYSYPGFNAGSPGEAAFNMGFLSFTRRQSFFEVQDSPNWRNANPGNVVIWKPKYPAVFYPGWTANCGQTGSSASVGGTDLGIGNASAVYGYMMSLANARELGFKIAAADTSKPSDYTYGWISHAPTASATDTIPSKSGHCIRILDISIRLQPGSGQATNILTIRQKTDNVNVFCVINNNPSDFVDLRFSPNIFLKAGRALEALVSVAGSASINVVYEYVPQNQLPGNTWFGCLNPVVPSPTGATTINWTSNRSSQFTLYNPYTDATFTAPTDADKQLVLRGYLTSTQKDTTQASEQIFTCLSAGTAAGAVKVGTTIASNQTNYQLSPVFSIGGHDQNVTAAVDDLNLYCGASNSLWADSMNFGTGNITSPSSSDSDISNWYWSAWGITAPKKIVAPTNRGA